MNSPQEALKITLNIGDKVTTNFSGRITHHTIIDSMPDVCQSGIMFKVHPNIPKSSGTWFDAAWFEPDTTRPACMIRPADDGIVIDMFKNG